MHQPPGEIQESDMMPVRQRMLVPLDGSPLAEVALVEALTLAKLPLSEVILLQVVPATENALRNGVGVGPDEEQRKASALRYLNDICSGPEWCNVRTRVAVEVGRPAEAILDFADQHGAERIVMATHGQTGLGRWVHGSVADKVLRAADRTVVLVYAARPPMADRPSTQQCAD
jgi:nucleotide-binding universal stress UspA family protein